MKATQAHNKGAQFERQICRRLSLWVSKGQRDDLFWRSATSGARATFQLKKGVQNRAQSGDMTAIAPQGYEWCDRYFFEYKHYKDLQIFPSILFCRGLLYRFWKRTQQDAHHQQKLPVLIARQNNYPILLITECIGLNGQSTPLVEIPSWPARIYRFDDIVTLYKPRPTRIKLEVFANDSTLVRGADPAKPRSHCRGESPSTGF